VLTGAGAYQSRAVARRAPSASASNLAHTIVGWTSGVYVACDEKPQSALAGSCAVILVEGVSDQSAVEGTRSGRKAHYGRVLTDAVDLTQIPRPLDRILAHV
jgi:hypothetical protein